MSRIDTRLRSVLSPAFWRLAAICLPAVPLLMTFGVIWDDAVKGLVMAGAAYSVGFGAGRSVSGGRWLVIVLAAVSIAAAAFLGSLAGQSFALMLAIIAVLAGACGALALLNEDRWWIALQVVIAFVIASYYPQAIPGAAERGALVLAGGAAQIACVLLLGWLLPLWAAPLPAAAPKEPPTRGSLLRHVLRAALAVTGAMWIARSLGLHHDYWAPMAALMVLKPGLTETRTRGIARLIGTVGGSALATGFALATGQQVAAMLAALTVAAFLSFALQKAHYAVFTAAVTMTVVTMIDLAQGAPLANAEQRIIATLMGGGLALLCAWALRDRALPTDPAPDRLDGKVR
ncbi:MAG: FUSC family protein [Paracoccus sp. (in: a-proteobacteria)]|uniref:FUSC family protein n=1 Tax=Paracoccus sp. TaxID=267 RepID=UPI0026DF20A5|nr:FUSC family protein [Paracoccus sp. (in: a-proteobacteria)]MDO5630868.1 FUSC family protein [Paracoccus sp. (in: a-proteobacteria)]